MQKKHRIDLSPHDNPNSPRHQGWEYSLPFGGCIRRFDSGHWAMFMYSSRKSRPYRTYVCHYSPDAQYLGNYRLTVSFHLNNDDSYDFYASGRTRREAFRRVRRQMTLARRIFQGYKMKSLDLKTEL